MDKETLSNYGWIVICVLVMVVMIALAGPFGTFVADAVKSTTQGLFDVNKGALDAADIDINNQSFPNIALNPDNGTTPVDGETYISTESDYDDYTYTYSEANGGWSVTITDKTKTQYDTIFESINGKPITSLYYTFQDCTSLTVAPIIPKTVTDMTHTFYGCTSLTVAPTIPNSVIIMKRTFCDCTNLKTYVGSTDPDGDFSGYVIPNGVTDMWAAFGSCASLVIAPVIPNSVTEMAYTFSTCSNLTTAPKIPNSVINMKNTFYNCTSLETAPDMSGATSLTGVYETFRGCTSLTTAPVIPSSVTDMFGIFKECTALTGTITIHANPTRWTNCFRDTDFEAHSITLTGDSTMLDTLGAIGENYCNTCNGKCNNNH